MLEMIVCGVVHKEPRTDSHYLGFPVVQIGHRDPKEGRQFREPISTVVEIQRFH